MHFLRLRQVGNCSSFLMCRICYVTSFILLYSIMHKNTWLMMKVNMERVSLWMDEIFLIIITCTVQDTICWFSEFINIINKQEAIKISARALHIILPLMILTPFLFRPFKSIIIVQNRINPVSKTSFGQSKLNNSAYETAILFACIANCIFINFVIYLNLQKRYTRLCSVLACKLNFERSPNREEIENWFN